MYCFNAFKHFTVTNASIDKDLKANTYYIHVEYEDDNNENVRKHTITAPLYFQDPVIDLSTFDDVADTHSIDVGCFVLKDAHIKTDIIKVKEKEMTVEDIEKALGHKVKIINKH